MNVVKLTLLGRCILAEELRALHPHIVPLVLDEA